MANSLSNSKIYQYNVDRTQHLHDMLTLEQLEELHIIFENAKGKLLDPSTLREILQNKFNIEFTDDEYRVLFLKLNTNRDNLCDWEEFVSHLIVGFREGDPYNQKRSLTLPIPEKPRVITKIIHHFPIIRTLFCPMVSTTDHNTVVNPSLGNYITVSKDGSINFWTLNFEYQKSAFSKNPLSKVKTWILDAVVLPDVRILCTCAVEEDLRFYDINANNFILRIHITSLPWYITKMSYFFHSKSYEVDSKLILGDCKGNIKIISFNPEFRGPFKTSTGEITKTMLYREFVKGKLPGFHVTEYNNMHVEMIRQVDYVESMNSILSVANCPDVKVGSKKPLAPGMVILNLGVSQTKTVFRIRKGMSCFWYDEASSLIATGGPDCILRIWKPTMPNKPGAIMPGHLSGIVFVFIQDQGERVYSMDRTHIIKVWDIREQVLLQTYSKLAPYLVEQCIPTVLYNDNRQELIVAGLKIVLTKCCPRLRLDLTDGYTHSKSVSVVLYNHLYKYIVTCGLDSYIIIWDPWCGKRISLIQKAHTRIIQGIIIVYEITAACFDPKHQLLLTGSRDGTLKVWDFMNNICIRNLAIEYMCEVSAVFWIPDKILAVGWNKHVTEFSDTMVETEFKNGKLWDTCHTEDVFAAAIKCNETMATSSYNGELILWKLETGQPYRRFLVGQPYDKIKIEYHNEKFTVSNAKHNKDDVKFYSSKYFKVADDNKSTQRSEFSKLSSPEKKSLYKRRISTVNIPTPLKKLRPLAVKACCFLENRPNNSIYGSLFVALDNGIVQLYTNNRLGTGYITEFNAVHMAGDCVTVMTTDKLNQFLFTATSWGYIKIWLISNYGIPDEAQTVVAKHSLRLKFPFLWRDRIEGRAKRSARTSSNIKLVSSYRAHLETINSLVYINETEMVISGSGDRSVRLWSLAGRYVGTLGSVKKWQNLSSSHPINSEHVFRIPPDIHPSASSTTLKVLTGGIPENKVPVKSHPDYIEQDLVDNESNAPKIDEHSRIYGKPLSEPLLGKHFQLPSTSKEYDRPILDKSLSYIPVYAHLNVYTTDFIERPLTPDALTRSLKNIEMAKKNCEY